MSGELWGVWLVHSPEGDVPDFSEHVGGLPYVVAEDGLNYMAGTREQAERGAQLMSERNKSLRWEARLFDRKLLYVKCESCGYVARNLKDGRCRECERQGVHVVRGRERWCLG